MARLLVHGFPVNRKIIKEGSEGEDYGNYKDGKRADFDIRDKEFEDCQTLKADGKEGDASGDDVGNGFHFTAQAGTHDDAFSYHQVADKKDAELPVNDQ